jgi:hypothetical protein
VTTVPIYLHLQPVLVPLPFAEPPSSKESDPSVQPKHLTFIVTLHDDVHGLKQSTVTEYSPADWMDVEYERSDWVEERLVDVIRVGVEIVIQEVRVEAVESGKQQSCADLALGGRAMITVRCRSNGSEGQALGRGVRRKGAKCDSRGQGDH